MRYIEVKNKKGTTDKKLPLGYESWLDFWKKKKNQNAIHCEVLNCNGKATVGGHVIKSGRGGKEYILPMCYKCNNKPDDDIFEAWESDLVSVK